MKVFQPPAPPYFLRALPDRGDLVADLDDREIARLRAHRVDLAGTELKLVRIELRGRDQPVAGPGFLNFGPLPGPLTLSLRDCVPVTVRDECTTLTRAVCGRR